MTERVILGIDPGLATIGYAFIQLTDDEKTILDFGVITTPAGLELSDRLLMIKKDLQQLIELHLPDEVVVEELFFGKNVTTAIDVAHARGVVLSTCAEQGLTPSTYTPNQIKQIVTGDGAADKRQVQDMLIRIFSLSSLPTPDDAADALAVAFCGAQFCHGELLAK